MIDYLLRTGYLEPTYGHGTRGAVRYYSYRDLVIARLIQRLRESGVELARLKTAIAFLKTDQAWKGKGLIRFLVSDGKRVHFRDLDGFLEEIGDGRQRSFAFVADIEATQLEIRKKIPIRKRQQYSMANEGLKDAPSRANRTRAKK